MVSEVSTRLQIEEYMEAIYRGDFAGATLGIVVQLAMGQVAGYKDSSFSVVSAQKKGNVLYLQLEMMFENVFVNDSPQPMTIYLVQEWFVVTGLDHVILVKAQIPAVERRSPAFSWFAQWLAGFRIPRTSLFA